MTLAKLYQLIERKKDQVYKEFKRRGYFENMGVKQSQEVSDAAMSIAHSHSANWSDRQAAGTAAIAFDRWLNSL